VLAVLPMKEPAMDTCSRTGLSVPECSCAACVEAMLRRFQPELLTGEIRITRTSDHPPRPLPDRGHGTRN
jgi:hypothetical protein